MKTPTQRLLGAWKSDRRRTLRYHAGYLRADGRRRRTYHSLFGKLMLRYTNKFVYITLNGDSTRERYKVISQDAASVVILVHRDAARRKVMRQNPMALEFLDFNPGLSTITFVHRGRGEYFWIGVNGVCCEWFRRQSAIEPTASGTRTVRQTRTERMGRVKLR